MSWIIGLIGSPIRVDLQKELLRSHSASEMIAESENYVVIANTQSATCLYSRRDDFSNDFFVLVGSPVLKEDGKYCPLDEGAFSSLLKDDVSTIHQHLAGQYSVVRSNGNRIELFSDPNTLRSLFVAEYDKQIVFSSHLHLISEIVQGLTIDFRSFGSHWMAHNQLSEKSLVTGVSRICGSDMWSVEMDTDRSGHGQTSRTLGMKKVTTQSTDFGRSKKDDPFRDILGFLGSYQGNLKLALSGRGTHINQSPIFPGRFTPFCTTVPLAKGSRTYPYTLPHSFLPLIFAVQKKFRKYRSLPAHTQSPYLKLREFVFDIVRSRSTRTYGPYDIDKIDQLGRVNTKW